MHLTNISYLYISYTGIKYKIRNTFSHAPLMHKREEQDFYFREVDTDTIININLDPQKLKDEFDKVHYKDPECKNYR